MFFIISAIIIKNRLIYCTVKKINPLWIEGKVSWNQNAINKRFYQKLNNYLISEDLQGSENELINHLNKKLENLKTPYVFVASIFSVLSIIIFKEFVNEIFKIASGNILSLILALISLIYIVVLIIYMLYTFKDLYLSLLTNYYSIQNLIEMLENNNLRNKLSLKSYE